MDTAQSKTAALLIFDNRDLGDGARPLGLAGWREPPRFVLGIDKQGNQVKYEFQALGQIDFQIHLHCYGNFLGHLHVPEKARAHGQLALDLYSRRAGR